MKLLHLVPVLGLVGGGIALLAPSGADAQPVEDCSKLKKWDSFLDYKEKDSVWHDNNNSGSDGAKYVCTKKSCKGSTEPRRANDTWKLVANCKSGSKPK